MVDIRVGDWVKTTDWSNFYEVVEVEKSHIKLLNSWGEKCSYSFSLDEYKFTIRNNPTPSPVREVVTKEIVDGVYGRIEIEQHNDDINPVFLRLMDRLQKEAQGQLGFNAKELRELAKTLNEVAEFLEGE